MSDQYVIRIIVENGDPNGVRTATHQNWKGKVVAFPKADWSRVKNRPELKETGVYILVGSIGVAQDSVPTIYIGQGDRVGERIALHFGQKDFWDFGVVVVQEGTPLNSAQARWLEHMFYKKAIELDNCYLDNKNKPKELCLAEWDLIETKGFFKKTLEVLPLLGVNAFDETALSIKSITQVVSPPANEAIFNTIVVPANEDGFNKVFLGEDCWYAIPIGSEMIDRIKYIAAYQTAPISAVTHYAPVKQIEKIEGTGKFKIIFAEHAKELTSIPFGDAKIGSMRRPKYTTYERLLKASSIRELLDI